MSRLGIETERWAAHRREHALEDRALGVASTLQSDALGLAREAIEHRLEGMNELREQITSERGSYVSRVEYEAKHDTLVNRVNELEKARSNVEGRMWALGSIVIIVELALRFFKL